MSREIGQVLPRVFVWILYSVRKIIILLHMVDGSATPPIFFPCSNPTKARGSLALTVYPVQYEHNTVKYWKWAKKEGKWREEKHKLWRHEASKVDDHDCEAEKGQELQEEDVDGVQFWVWSRCLEGLKHCYKCGMAHHCHCWYDKENDLVWYDEECKLAETDPHKHRGEAPKISSVATSILVAAIKSSCQLLHSSMVLVNWTSASLKALKWIDRKKDGGQDDKAKQHDNCQYSKG